MANEKKYDDMTPEEQREFLRKLESDRNQQISEMRESAMQGIMTDPNQMIQYLEVQSRFDRMSVNNALLIMKQMPEATAVKPFSEWERLSVHILKEAKGILLTRYDTTHYMKDGVVKEFSRFKPYLAFDVSQTDCIPERPKEPNIEQLCKDVHEYISKEYEIDMPVNDTDLGMVIFRAIRAQMDENAKYGDLISACSTISLCKYMNFEPPALIRTVLERTLAECDITDFNQFRSDILEPARAITRDFKSDFIQIQKRNAHELNKVDQTKETVMEDEPFEISDEDPDPPVVNNNGEVR
ncbi:hypothetical protein SAMN02910456_02554 [Ruminococcaceae bacterium YRB3002]|nr:hypothetical protein SAMN02910456_02554 [Ruminococcaceae bacterium YRB3002]